MDELKKSGAYVYNGIYSTFKRNTNLTHGSMWMNLDDITLTKISQSPKDKTLYDSILLDILNIKLIEMVVTVCGEGEWEIVVQWVEHFNFIK